MQHPSGSRNPLRSDGHLIVDEPYSHRLGNRCNDQCNRRLYEHGSRVNLVEL